MNKKNILKNDSAEYVMNYMSEEYVDMLCKLCSTTKEDITRLMNKWTIKDFNSMIEWAKKNENIIESLPKVDL